MVMTDSQIVAALRRAFAGEDLQAIGYGRHPDSIARCGAVVRTLDDLLNPTDSVIDPSSGADPSRAIPHESASIAPSLQDVARELASRVMMSQTPDQRAAAVLMAVHDTIDPYDDARAELRDLARTIREGGERIAADPTVVTAEAFDRVAVMLEALARAI